MAGKRIVLTADRSLMTNYRGNFLYGFIACGPYEVLPEWVFDKVLKPLWDWFEGMFPDVAQKMKDLWAEFTGGLDSIIGKIGTFFKGLWEWFKGMFVFDDIGGAVSALLDFVFLPTNLIVKLISSVWDFIKGLFGFKKDEAKLPDDFSIGSMITGFIDDIAKWFGNLFAAVPASVAAAFAGGGVFLATVPPSLGKAADRPAVAFGTGAGLRSAAHQ